MALLGAFLVLFGLERFPALVMAPLLTVLVLGTPLVTFRLAMTPRPIPPYWFWLFVAVVGSWILYATAYYAIGWLDPWAFRSDSGVAFLDFWSAMYLSAQVLTTTTMGDFFVPASFGSGATAALELVNSVLLLGIALSRCRRRSNTAPLTAVER